MRQRDARSALQGDAISSGGQLPVPPALCPQENIEDQLDANGVDYDYDEGGHMIVSEEDMDAVIEIVEDCGVSAELV